MTHRSNDPSDRAEWERAWIRAELRRAMRNASDDNNLGVDIVRGALLLLALTLPGFLAAGLLWYWLVRS